MTNTTTRGTMSTKTTKIRIGTTFTRYGGGYPDNIATVVERQRGRRGDASRTMYVLANSSGQRQEVIGRETLLKLSGNCLEKCSDCGVLLRDCGPRCAVCDDTSTDDSE